jgi:NADPH:quinone reductase-like Zn-dependent oxidoreductase
MSMAIEAIRQVNELEGTAFSKVTLRDLDISTALVIPDNDDGIEVHFRLQKASDAGTKSQIWYSFSVESISGGQWTLHSRGLIASSTEIRSSGRNIPHTVSAFTQRASGKRWYDAFHSVGFDYRRSFQPLQSIQSNGKDHAALASLKISRESGLMKDESRYLLHPATVDACLQLIIISIHRGLHKDVPWGVIPVHIQEVNMWIDDNITDCIGQAEAWTDNRDGRHYNTQTVLRTTDGKAILDVKDLRCIVYEAAVPQSITVARDAEPYMQVSWKPDISYFRKLSGPDSPKTIESDSEALATLIDLANHKSPVKGALLIGNFSVSVFESVQKLLPADVSLRVGVTETSAKDQLDTLREGYNFKTLLLTREREGWKDVISDPSDLIVLCKDMIDRTTDEIIKVITAERGVVVVLGDSIDAEAMTFNFPDAGYSQVGPHFFRLADASNDLHNSTNELELVIATMNTESQSSRALGAKLEDLGFKVRFEKLSGMDVSSSHRIVIDDSEGRLFTDLDEVSYLSLRAAVCSSLPIIWLTKGVIQGETIAGGMAQGFLRAVRSEQATPKITLLDIDAGESEQTTAELISDFLRKPLTKDFGKETEYWLHQDTVYTSRIIPNSRLNAPYKRHNASTVTLPKKAALSGSFAHQSLIFDEMSDGNEPLGSSEVELQVLATDFQKSDIQTGAERLRLVVGEVINVTSDDDSHLLGQTSVVFCNSPFSTVVRVPRESVATTDDGDITNLAATLPWLCSAVQSVVQIGNLHKGHRLLVLPASAVFTSSIVALSKIYGFEVSVVFRSEEEYETYKSNYSPDFKSSFLEKDLPAIQEFAMHESSSLAIIASEFDSLSQEVWRSLGPFGRFILNDTTVTSWLDPLPLTKGASFVATGLRNLYQNSPLLTKELLSLTLSLLGKHREALNKNCKALDIGSLSKETAIAQINESNVVAYDYGKSEVTVCLQPVYLIVITNNYF